MFIVWLVLVFFWFWFAYLIGKSAEKKGRSFGQFFAISLLISPVIGFIVVASIAPISKSDTPIRSSNDSRLASQGGESLVKCPYCAEFVKFEASVCRYCHQDISGYVLEIKADLNAKSEQDHRLREALDLEQKQLLEEVRQRAHDAKLAADEKRSALFRSVKFRVSLTSGVVAVLAILVVSISVAANVAAQKHQKALAAQHHLNLLIAEFHKGPNSPYSQWSQIAQNCRVSPRVILGLDLKISSLNGSQQDCLMWNLDAGSPGKQAAGQSTKSILIAGKIEWTPTWSALKVKQVQAGNVLASKTYDAVKKCSPEALIPSTQNGVGSPGISFHDYYFERFGDLRTVGDGSWLTFYPLVLGDGVVPTDSQQPVVLKAIGCVASELMGSAKWNNLHAQQLAADYDNNISSPTESFSLGGIKYEMSDSDSFGYLEIGKK